MKTDNNWVSNFFEVKSRECGSGNRTYQCLECKKDIYVCNGKELQLEVIKHLKSKCRKTKE